MAKTIRQRAHTHHATKPKITAAVKVEEFSCRDATTYGKHHKSWVWKLRICEEIHTWELKVDQQLIGPSIVRFSINGVEKHNNKLQQNFEYQLPVREALQFNKHYEVKTCEFHEQVATGNQFSSMCNQWYPAVLTGKGVDGNYVADMFLRDENGHPKKVHYPFVPANHIRDPVTKKLVEAQTTMVLLQVKKDSALWPELTINGRSFTSYMCVPAVATPAEEIVFMVDKNQTAVTANVGHGQLSDALEATNPGYKVRSKSSKKTNEECKWQIQIGASGSHTIVVKKDSQNGKELNVLIDDILVVSGAVADLACRGIDFTFHGNLALKCLLDDGASSWKRFASDGTPKRFSTDKHSRSVTKSIPYSNTVRITCPDLQNLVNASLECDDVYFAELKPYIEPTEEEDPKIQSDVETIEQCHGIMVPWLWHFSDTVERPAGSSGTWGIISDVLLSLVTGNLFLPSGVFEEYCYEEYSNKKAGAAAFSTEGRRHSRSLSFGRGLYLIDSGSEEGHAIISSL